jgi:uncharacterized membrane protein YgcG
VSLAFLYNFWVMIYRFSFNEINAKNRLYWFTFDYFADFLYVCDIMFNFRTGYLEEGVLQTDPVRLRHHYMNTTRFYVDCLCLMPLDILYLSIGYNSLLRCFRLVKIYRFWAFLDRTERHTNYPNVFRTIVMLHYLFAIFHWNACISYFLGSGLSLDIMIKCQYGPQVSPFYSYSQQSSQQQQSQQQSLINANDYGAKTLIGQSASTSPSSSNLSANSGSGGSGGSGSSGSGGGGTVRQYSSNVNTLKYLKAFYMSTKIMTLVSEIPNPKRIEDYMFAICQLIIALLLFATIMGHVSYIVSNLGNSRKEFQCK